MNERIRLLLVEAREQTKEGKWNAPTAVWAEKFAELLVRESAQFLNGAVEVYTQAEQDACDRAARGLKRHFGVE